MKKTMKQLLRDSYKGDEVIEYIEELEKENKELLCWLKELAEKLKVENVKKQSEPVIMIVQEVRDDVKKLKSIELNCTQILNASDYMQRNVYDEILKTARLERTKTKLWVSTKNDL